MSRTKLPPFGQTSDNHKSAGNGATVPLSIMAEDKYGAQSHDSHKSAGTGEPIRVDSWFNNLNWGGNDLDTK